MSKEFSRDRLSIQNKIAEQKGLLRNILIGAELGVASSTGWNYFLYISEPGKMLVPLGVGAIIGGIATLAAVLGHKAAEAGHEGKRPINWRAIRYSSVIIWGIGILLISLAMITADRGVGTALVLVTSGAVLGSIIASILTIGASVGIRALNGQSASQTQMLGEGGFDPLHSIKNREHAQR